MRYSAKALREPPGQGNGRHGSLITMGGESWVPSSSGRTERTPACQVRRILVAVDFSPSTTEAVGYATTLASQFDAELTLLHVVDVNAQAESGSAEALMTRLREEGSAQLQRLAFSQQGKGEVQTVMEEGLPWDVIVEESRKYDLVILGQSNARRGWRLFSNHTAQRVTENAACPVMVVHSGG
jgi:nucleotide-binding universal stress UspA family protein